MGGAVVFGPTRVTDGIELSDDPILRFRIHAYAESVLRRTGARGRARKVALVLRRLLALAVTIGSVAIAAPAAPASAGGDAREVHIGALLSLTGDGADLGTTSKEALEIAAQRWNAGKDKKIRVVLDVENTNLEPEQAQAALTRLADKGVRIAIGPQSSAEVAAISEQAAARGVILVSQGSTASSLGLPDDNVFRFVPNDRVEGRAITDLMLSNGASTIIPMWRNDRGNNGLAESVRTAATSSGATVTDGVRYEPDATDFSATLADLNTQVQAAVASAGADKVAVYLAGFEEVADIFTAARMVTGLDGVRWYGGDGSAQTKVLLDSGPATFATSVKVRGYPSPLVALPASQAKRAASLLRQISKRAKNEADAFTLAAYDAFNVAARTLAEAPADADAATLRAAFARTAEGAKGTTGTIRLDPAGDHLSTPYAFWSVCQRGKSPRWTETGTWTPANDPTAPGRVRSKTCPER